MSMFSINSSKCTPRLGRGLLEGVEVHHHHVDGLDAMLCYGGPVQRILAPVQDTAVHLGM